MNEKPVIGVIACNKPLEGETAQAVKNRYIEAVINYADAIPLIFPSFGRPDDAGPMIARVHALMLTGATSNVEPRHYGADGEADPKDPNRDMTSLSLIKAAHALNMPIIGICRGMQEINVALGGTLADQRENPAGKIAHHSSDDATLEEMFSHYHPIDIAPGSNLQKVVGTDKMLVNSVHYQRVERLGDDLRVEATSADGVVEAIASRSGPSIFAVQWHPEWRPQERPADLAFWRHVGQLARMRQGAK
mgnify:CR=1 FL=1